ncbi:MAG: YihY/virulence factor BrkB family protein [Chloroflexi bacterium]|nr:YihY/virulence factor BrkB family protein [Chloroflexota bacterium]
MKQKLEAFQRSGVGMFVKKLLDDQTPNLAALLAWGTLTTVLPLLLGMLAIAGLILRDPQRLDQVYNFVLAVVPSEQSGPLGQALDGVRRSSGTAFGVGLVLLLFNGSSFFANMAGVFDQAYHVESRNVVVQRLVSLVMLVIITALLVVSTLALGIGSLLGSVPLGLGTNPVVGRVMSWSLSIVSAFVLFLLLYKILPNARQTWRNVLPGTLLSTVLFFVLLGLFPLYARFFPPNQAYAVFGVFLVFTFFLWLLGFVFVLGAELNAFLQQPARALALAEATERAEHGKAAYQEQPGELAAESTGRAPEGVQRIKPLFGAPQMNPQTGQHEPGGTPQGGRAHQPRAQAGGASMAGRVLGFVGLVFAVVLLRNKAAERV